MSKVLGRIVDPKHEAPRGPDVSHRVRVPSAWLDEGAKIRVTLPRNLNCAACGGGGCDRCSRAGAISVRERGAPSEAVEVCLPRREGDEPFVVRIPEQGGVAEDASLPRGMLLLHVVPNTEPDTSVERCPDLRQLSQHELERKRLITRSLVMAIALSLLFLVMLRLSGWL